MPFSHHSLFSHLLKQLYTFAFDGLIIDFQMLHLHTISLG